ncbi:hypothetical protein MBLNU457_7366t2 [Dothideomycetes sp. NU457]
MAAPSYAQAMTQDIHRVPNSTWNALDSDGYQSSIADTSTRMAPSDTEDGHYSTHGDLDLIGPLSPTSGLRIHTGKPASPARRTSIPRPSPRTPRSVTSPSNIVSPSRSLTYGSSDGDFFGSGPSRPDSIYSLSRVSFASQLTQLTSIQLPSASSLSARISSQTTAHLAAKALFEAGDQIKTWIGKAAEVLDDLDAKDDVEWAAAAGREGLDDVDQAITRFEGLVKVYVISMEELQLRKDITTLSDETLKGHVSQMDGVVRDWTKIKESLKGVKEQVEIAMEWEELSNSVLSDIGQELDALAELVFEMEEKRHKAGTFEDPASTPKTIDINDLASIVEGKSGDIARSPRGKLPPPFSPSSPIEPPSQISTKEDSSLLALFARMQPLRASLDFLPMRLSVFHVRGSKLFPSACVDLEDRRNSVEDQWKKLDADAEALRKELGEDRWVLVFRNAGRQAMKMFESIERTHDKLKEALNANYKHHDTARMIESYEAKKTHYVPAVERVLAIIDRGVMDRLTVNGEILRLQSDMKRKWTILQTNMRDMDVRLETDHAGQQLRDSISTILSSERSLASSTLDTPRSSPASSVVGRSISRKSSFSISTPTQFGNGFARPRRSSGIPRATPSRQSNNPTPRSVTTPMSLRLAEPFRDKREDLVREFKTPVGKPRWSSVSAATTTVKTPSSSRRSDFRNPQFSQSYSESASLNYNDMTPKTRKYTPTKLAISSIPTPRSRAVSPSPSSHASISTRLPARAASAMDTRSSSLPISSPYKTRTPGRVSSLGSTTPSTSKKRDFLSLPTVNDTLFEGESGEEGDSEVGLPLPRSGSRTSNAMAVSRPSSRLGTPARTERPGSRASGIRPPSALAGSVVGRRSSLSVARRRSSVAHGGAEDPKPRWMF